MTSIRFSEIGPLKLEMKPLFTPEGLIDPKDPFQSGVLEAAIQRKKENDPTDLIYLRQKQQYKPICTPSLPWSLRVVLAVTENGDCFQLAAADKQHRLKLPEVALYQSFIKEAPLAHAIKKFFLTRLQAYREALQ